MVATADASAAATQCILHASTLNDIFNDAQWKSLQLKIQVSWWQKSKQITVIHLQPSIIILRCIRRSFLKTSIVKLVSMLLNCLIARLSKIKWRDKENYSNLMTRLSPVIQVTQFRFSFRTSLLLNAPFLSHTFTLSKNVRTT